MTTNNTVSEGIPILKRCKGCGNAVPVLSVQGSLCVSCLSVKRSREERRIEARQEQFDAFMRDNKDKAVKCVVCSVTAKMIDAHETGWRMVNRKFICSNCLKAHSRKNDHYYHYEVHYE